MGMWLSRDPKRNRSCSGRLIAVSLTVLELVSSSCLQESEARLQQLKSEWQR